MFVVSTAKTTILTDFNDLETKSTYQHSKGENTDFQFYAQQRIFVEVNKKSGLEIMRVKEKAQSEYKNESIVQFYSCHCGIFPEVDLQRVRKLTIDNVYCVACAKQSMEEMAVGLSNGQVKLYNYTKSEFVHKFNAGKKHLQHLYIGISISCHFGQNTCILVKIVFYRTSTYFRSFLNYFSLI